MLKISVIIPAFNVQNYIEKSIKSALHQDETAEVIVIDDGSTDNTFNICKQLELSYDILRVLQHYGGVNKGRAASRNLGIRAATQDYIAFLDADDFYLENRFANDKRIFEKQPSCDGVYNAIGAHFYRKPINEEMETLALTTMSEKVTPEALFSALLSGRLGSFSIDGLTVKKKAIAAVNYFNEDLKVMEDTEFLWKLTLKSNLMAGDLRQPVAMRGVHDQNVFNKSEVYQSQELKFYESLFYWSISENLANKITEQFLERMWIVKSIESKSIITECLYWLKIIVLSPQLLISNLHYKYSPVRRVRRFFRSSNK